MQSKIILTRSWILNSPREFNWWLQYNKTNIVGNMANIKDLPFCRFILEQGKLHPNTIIEVGIDYIYLEDRGWYELINTPEWIQETLSKLQTWEHGWIVGQTALNLINKD